MSAVAPPHKRGLFIVFEGVDRSGKSTQAKRIVEKLREEGHPMFDQHFPDYSTPTGAFLRDYLDKKHPAQSNPLAAHLMFAANRAEVMPALEALLAQGLHVVCDRYVYSGVAYSMAKGMDMARCQAMEASLPRPDAVLYFDAPASVVAARKGFGEELHDDRAFLERVRAAYMAPGFKAGGQMWINIDAAATIESVTAQVDLHVSRIFELVQLITPMPTLYQ